MAELSHTPGFFDSPEVAPAGAAQRRRRLTGALYGLGLSAAYSLTAGTINWVLLRDVPLGLNWPAVLGKVLVSGLVGLGLGLLTAWPEDFVPGVIFGALGISIGGTVYSLATSEFSFQLTVALLVTLLSRAALSGLIALPLRTLAYWHEEAVLDGPAGARLRAGLPVAALALGVLFGSLSQMPPAAKAAVRQTHRIMQNGLNAQTAAEMPPALRRAPNFKTRAGPGYVLEQRLEEFSFDRLFTVTVYFDNGYVVSCLYPPRGSPVCEESGA